MKYNFEPPKIGDRFKDSEGNEFCVSEVVPHRDPLMETVVNMRGHGGTKGVVLSELKFFYPEPKRENYFTYTDKNGHAPYFEDAHYKWRNYKGGKP